MLNVYDAENGEICYPAATICMYIICQYKWNMELIIVDESSSLRNIDNIGMCN